MRVFMFYYVFLFHNPTKHDFLRFLSCCTHFLDHWDIIYFSGVFRDLPDVREPSLHHRTNCCCFGFALFWGHRVEMHQQRWISSGWDRLVSQWNRAAASRHHGNRREEVSVCRWSRWRRLLSSCHVTEQAANVLLYCFCWLTNILMPCSTVTYALPYPFL